MQCIECGSSELLEVTEPDDYEPVYFCLDCAETMYKSELDSDEES